MVSRVPTIHETALELEWDEDNPLDYVAGFGRLFRRDDDWAEVIAPRPFSFTPQSRYKVLVTSVLQYEAIARYEATRYIPFTICSISHGRSRTPSPRRWPTTRVTGTCDVGCRVVPAQQLRRSLDGQPAAHSPAYEELRHNLAGPFTLGQHRGGWRSEHFVVDLLLDCEAGYIASSPRDGGPN